MELISVIVPAYNVESCLKRCVDSICSQTYPELEIILVDDGSSDNTGGLCEKLAEEDPRITVIHKENGGLSDARNAGLAIASGAFISFIDGDDYIEPDMYEAMAAEMANEDVSLVAAGIIETNMLGQNTCYVSDEKLLWSKEEAFMDLFTGRRMFPSSCNKLFRKELFNGIRYVKGILNEDTEIIPRILNVCSKVVILNKAVYHYVLRKESITQIPFRQQEFDCLWVYKSAVNVCRENYPQLVPYADYYELNRLYQTLERMSTAQNSGKLFRQRCILRARIGKKLAECRKWKEIRDKYKRELFIYQFAVVFGYGFTYRAMMIKQKLTKNKLDK